MDLSEKLLKYAKDGDVKKIESLLEKHPNLDVNTYGNKGEMPLHEAAYRGHAKTCKILVKLGAEVNIYDINGLSPLHWAAHKGHAKTCKILVKLGAKVNSGDVYEVSPLHRAANKGYDKICEILIKEGAKITTKIFEKLTEKCKELVVLYENKVDPELTELSSKIKKRKEEKKKLLSNYFPPGLFNFILKY